MAIRNLFIFIFFSISILLTNSAFSTPVLNGTDGVNEYEPVFSEHEYRAHLDFLGGDICEGRAIGTRGGDLAAAYIAAQFQAAGLKAFEQFDGYYQNIPFKGIQTLHETVNCAINNGSSDFELKVIEDIVLYSEHPEENITYEDDLLFVGYGIESPEYDWDDYKDVDVAGKTLVMLVNDPNLEKTGFANESLSYYGRYTYKQQMARFKGAKGLILLHSTPTATYGMEVVRSTWSKEWISFDDPSKNPLGIFAWISGPAIDKVLAEAELSFDKLQEMADSREFRPFSLGLRFFASFKQKVRTMSSPNVVGYIPGTELKDECVVFTAHYDHFGIGIPDETGDNIYNGASDNASGTSALICLARAFSQSPVPPKRTLIFFANTGEESGLLGSTYYVQNPPMSLEKTVILINKDSVGHLGKRAAFRAFPSQYSTAAEDAAKIGEGFGLELQSVVVDKSGFSFRSDHFPFAARGIVAMSVSLIGENTSITKEKEETIRKEIGRTYHQTTDEVHPLWRYDGAILELQLLYALGQHWADGAAKPSMHEGNPFEVTQRIYSMLESED